MRRIGGPSLFTGPMPRCTGATDVIGSIMSIAQPAAPPLLFYTPRNRQRIAESARGQSTLPRIQPLSTDFPTKPSIAAAKVRLCRLSAPSGRTYTPVAACSPAHPNGARSTIRAIVTPRRHTPSPRSPSPRRVRSPMPIESCTRRCGHRHRRSPRQGAAPDTGVTPSS